jgi:hypothetical protein
MSHRRNFNILSTHRKNFCVNLAGKEPNNYGLLFSVPVDFSDAKFYTLNRG